MLRAATRVRFVACSGATASTSARSALYASLACPTEPQRAPEDEEGPSKAKAEPPDTARRSRRPPEGLSPAELRAELRSFMPERVAEEEAAAPVSDWRAVVEQQRALQAAPGWSPSTLTDSFGRVHSYLRISLTERCNLRCLYCMPEDGVDLTPSPDLLSAEEVMRVARLFVAAGVTKIRLTGGEPTLRPDLVDIVGRLAALRGVTSVALTSNGIVLGRSLADLRRAGLTHVNISLDTLRPERFLALTRRRGHARVLDAVRLAGELGFDPVKVNVVLMRGVNDDEVGAFAELTRDQPVNVRFIEYMPFDGNVWSDSKVVPYRAAREAVERHVGAPLEALPAPPGEVARNFRAPEHRGSISFITSMTKAFCGDCNRLRIMADGNLKVCLFGANEVSLRDAMRQGATDEELALIVQAAVWRKKAAHAGMFELASTANRAMVKIGG
ncbi:hypothetical protein QBZ16_004117 [Prototheca wickerhamii]|uniref:GTP 3',8-cyclase n=1 Tax=Prototheca wickerhamii TaxID=3111 RepID=A0AAD9IH90_PROWI|nr:hypothetical protein QBZ16_004117 [Prototheca wickerhamii]